MVDMFSIKDKVIIVTGSGKGIGYVYAKGLAEKGAKIAICDINQENLNKVEQEFKGAGYQVVSQKVDITNQSEIENFVKEVINNFGKIDVLINNAGVLLRRLPEEMLENEWDFIMDINVKGTFLFSQAVGKEMIKADCGGKIINISSQAGVRAADRRLGYCTSKAAIIHFTRTLANEWGKHKINVNAIGPGYIKTDMNTDLRADPVRYAKMKQEVPLGDFGEPEDILGTIFYLCSGASDYVTGQIIFVDGGITTQ
ncbi:MAG: hypothetical protein JM58_17600 [Peptococcaceae bacterium BICA1-8]|nr:MAG: hypothetical protein JM58_17600 [Peptococcaceae bacterium BICA1-8]